MDPFSYSCSCTYTPVFYFTIALSLLFPSASISLSLPLPRTLKSHYSPINSLSCFLLHCLLVSFFCPSISFYFLYLPLPSCPLLISYHLSLSSVAHYLSSNLITLHPIPPSYDDLQGLCCAPNLKTFKVFPHRDRTPESRPE